MGHDPAGCPEGCARATQGGGKREQHVAPPPSLLPRATFGVMDHVEAARVLRAAHHLVRTGGFGLNGAINRAGAATISAEWARRLVRRVIGSASIPAWEGDSIRTVGDQLYAIERAMTLARAPVPRRGGWRVGQPHQRMDT